MAALRDGTILCHHPTGQYSVDTQVLASTKQVQCVHWPSTLRMHLSQIFDLNWWICGLTRIGVPAIFPARA